MIADQVPDQLGVNEQDPAAQPPAGQGPCMSLEEFVEELAAALDEASVIRLSPGPIDLKVGEDDRRAVQALRLLLQGTKGNLTFGQAEGILMYNALKEMKRVAEAAADAPADAPGTNGDTAQDRPSTDDDLPPEVEGILMADMLHEGNVGAFLTAWWWLVFWSAHDREPKDSSLLPLTPATIDEATASPPVYGVAYIVE